ncbi:MAG TPA: HYR domain-containing protein, partial [Polyangia bacterium]|nr:HYR domain-containing protein [Polyangia bacterium]
LLPAVTCVPAALPPPDGPGGGLWFPMGDTQVSCTAVDAGNNQAHGSFFVHVVDRSPPTVTVPAPITAEATGPDGASVGFPSSAFDLVDSTVTVACDRATGIGAAKPVTSGAVFPLGESTVTCRATDHAGNTGAASFAVVVHDTTAPSLTLPTPAVPGDPALIFEASPDTGTAALNFRTTGTGNDVVKATDAVACPEGDATLKCTVACTPRVGSQLLPGLTTVNCVVRDAAGNESQGSFTVRVHGRGGVCTTGADCGSGFCVDGVCCASACGGGDPTDCQACSVAAGGTTDGLCTPVSAAHVCRPSAGVCDAAETCDGSSLQCPANGFAPAGTGCRASAGVCDTAEVCTGSSAQCPADQLTAAGTICRAGAGACDVAEVCSGSSAACPPDALLSAGSVCRASAGACDVAETCSGSSATCPPDALRTAGTTCRASAGACDVAETCSGSSAACPPDALKAAGTTCRASAGACDVAEACSGSAATCPPDSFVAAGTTCRASAGACDVAEVCSGSAATCPVDSLVAAGTTCRASAGTCDVAEACSGSSAACPPDALKAAVTTCRASAGTCDVAETCSGSAATCPPDSFVAAGTVCAPASNSCQTPGKCSGGGPVCPGVTPIPGCSTDTTPPVFTNVPGTIVAFATTTAGAKVSYTKPTATDAVDGVRPVTCTPASDSTFQPGKTTVSCTAADKSGNSKTVTFTIWVQYQAPTDGTFFLAPIRANGSSIFRIGRPVPVRFRLTGASAGITNLVAKLIVTKISNTVSGTTIDTSDEDTDDTDFIFKFRSGLKIYAYRWKTSNQTQGTYQLKADLGDGVVHQVNVSLKSGW